MHNFVEHLSDFPSSKYWHCLIVLLLQFLHDINVLYLSHSSQKMAHLGHVIFLQMEQIKVHLLQKYFEQNLHLTQHFLMHILLLQELHCI
jgi:hypothetical protein